MWSLPAYVLDESEAGLLPQDKFKELAHLAATPEYASHNEQKIGIRQRMLASAKAVGDEADASMLVPKQLGVKQQMLVCAKVQRDLYPLGNFLGSTEPCLLAEGHIQLCEAYRAVPGHLQQVTSGSIPCTVLLAPGSYFPLRRNSQRLVGKACKFGVHTYRSSSMPVSRWQTCQRQQSSHRYC